MFVMQQRTARGILHETYIDSPVTQPLFHILTVTRQHGDLNPIGNFHERGQHRRQQVHGYGRAGSYRELAPPGLGQQVHVVFQPLIVRQQTLGMRQQQLSGLGQGHTRSTAHKKRHSETPLQLADMTAHGRLCDTESSGAFGKTQSSGRSDKHP